MLRNTTRRLAATLTAGVLATSLSGVAHAECKIFQNPGYKGKVGVVQNNDYVRFSGNAPAKKNRTFDDHWWHNRVTGVQVTENCKAVFSGHMALSSATSLSIKAHLQCRVVKTISPRALSASVANTHSSPGTKR